jgi:hypothetical protein
MISAPASTGTSSSSENDFAASDRLDIEMMESIRSTYRGPNMSNGSSVGSALISTMSRSARPGRSSTASMTRPGHPRIATSSQR